MCSHSHHWIAWGISPIVMGWPVQGGGWLSFFFHFEVPETKPRNSREWQGFSAQDCSGKVIRGPTASPNHTGLLLLFFSLAVCKCGTEAGVGMAGLRRGSPSTEMSGVRQNAPPPSPSGAAAGPLPHGSAHTTPTAQRGDQGLFKLWNRGRGWGQWVCRTPQPPPYSLGGGAKDRVAGLWSFLAFFLLRSTV